MIAAWMLWSVFVALVIGLAARALDAVVAAWGAPRRGVWLAAVLAAGGASGLGLWQLADPALRTAAASAGGASGFLGPGPLGDPAAAGAWWTGRLDAGLGALSDAITSLGASVPVSDATLVAAWAVSTAVAAGLWAAGTRRLRRSAGPDPSWEVDGVPVCRTEEAGPAVAGVLRPRILWPRWADGLDPVRRRTMLLHEREHVAARDPVLLSMGLGLAVLLPWNPVSWWLYCRLRSAVETDCDRRVLRRSIDTAAYAGLLLYVAERRSTGVPALALVPPENRLEERIDAMTAPRPRHRTIRTAALGAATLGLALVACETPVPVEVVDDASPEGRSARATVEGAPDAAGAGAVLRVTGDTTIALSREPLVFLDGDRVAGGTGSLSALDPDDIESIEVVKGAPALERYGEEAAYGVVRITTKSGSH